MSEEKNNHPPLRRPPDRVLGGVCAALADRSGIPVALVRVAAIVLLTVSGGLAVLAYLIGWILIPRGDAPARPAPARGHRGPSVAAPLRPVFQLQATGSSSATTGSQSGRGPPASRLVRHNNTH